MTGTRATSIVSSGLRRSNFRFHLPAGDRAGAVFLPGWALPVLPFNGFSLQWYEAVFADRKLMSALLHSFMVATFSSVIRLPPRLSGRLCARALQRCRAQPRQRGLLIAPMTVSYLSSRLVLTVLNVLGIGPVSGLLVSVTW